MAGELRGVRMTSPALRFEDQAIKIFEFLIDFGFTLTSVKPTQVIYSSDGVSVALYRGRRSYEIGCDIEAFGHSYGLGQLIRATAPEVVEKYRYNAGNSQGVIFRGLTELSLLLRQHADAGLRGDKNFFEIVKESDRDYLKKYALEVIAKQVRPKASEAFRIGNFKLAVELYSQMAGSLTVVEEKNLLFSKKKFKNA
jgi:hypothetical protein